MNKLCKFLISMSILYSGLYSYAVVTSLLFFLTCLLITGSIYALGGYNSSWLNSAERFDPREGRWYRIRPMLSPRSSYGLSVMGSCLYVVGGFNGLRNLNSAESYDTKAGKWMAAPPLQNTRYGLALATLVT